MIPGRQLQVNFLGNLVAYYKRTDLPIIGAQGNINDNVDYSDFKVAFENGNGDNKCNLLYHERYSLPSGTSRVYNIDGGLVNIWGDVLDYNDVKILSIHSRSTTKWDNLVVNFKNDTMNIGPQGSRILIEPYGRGIGSLVTSSSSEEGPLTLTNQGNHEITYDLIIVGSNQEESSSSG